MLFATYPWAFETPGGGEVQILKYAKYLPSHGVEVAFHDPWRSNLANTSVFHFFSCLAGSTHFCAYVKAQRLPVVISSSLWLDDRSLGHYPIDDIRAQLGLADVIVTNSDSESERLAGVLGLAQDRFVAVMNGVEPWFATADPRPFREAFGIEGAFILNVGNIEPRKNQLALVRATAGLGLPLVLIGRRRDRAYAEQVAAEGGDRLRELGPFDQDDPRLASAMAACAAFALPSTLETPGLAALEAAASGAAVVITSEGATRDYFADHVEYVDHADPADIRRGLARALARGPDPALRAHVTARFAWSAVTADLVKVYRLAIERASRSD